MLGKLKVSIFATVLAATAALAAPKPLTVWIMPNGASPQEKLEQRLNLFTKKTGIPTQVQVLDWGEAWNRISLALSGQQEAPDVLQLGTTWIPYFASRKEIKPLNGWLKDIDPSRYVPVSWNTTHMDADTTIYSVPWFIDIRPVLGNKRILKKYGITKESVSTYRGFVDAVKKIEHANETLEDGTKIHGYAFPGKSDWNIPHNFAPWVWSNGGSFVKKDEEGKWQANILSEETLLGIASYLHFVVDTLVQAEVLQTNTAQVAQQFNNGELAFIVSTTEIMMQTRFDGSMGGLSNARIGADSVVAIPFPSGAAGSSSFIGGSNLAIPAGNKRAEAKDLLLFLVNDENQDAYTKQIGLLPTSKKVLANWAKDEDYAELIKALETGKTYVTIPEWGTIEQQLVAMFSSVWEMMEIPSLYSEEKLYSIFKQYTIEINKTVNHPTANVMTEAEFKAMWENLFNKKIHNHGEKPSKDTTSKDNRDEIVNSNLSKAPFVFIAMVILGFLFNFRRKRKQ
ncbi:MAG: extracellular solute-binding protein [Fibrobacter sp.]|nr:extracellular solute-binding protein [Fibrobacter sp.]